MIYLSLSIGIYSIIASKYPYSSDRANYATRFSNQWDSPWTLGLNLVANFLHIFTNDPKILFFFISFLCLFVTLVSYLMFEDAKPEALILMSISNYCIYSLFLLKQAPSVAFASIAIAALFKRKWFNCIIFLVISISFHEAALILVPLFIAMLGAKKRWVRVIEYIVLILSVLFFSRASIFATNIIEQWLPSVTEQLDTYLDENSNLKQSINFLTIVKGFPYYYITFFALNKRKVLIYKIKNYDRFLVLSVFSSAMILLSGYMYWMWRFALYGYFPMFIFSSLIIQELKGKERQNFYYILIITFFLLTFYYLYQMFFLHGGF